MSDVVNTSESKRAPILSEPESRAVRRGVPDPGIALPYVSIPTLGLWVASLALWVFATWLVLGAGVTAWVTVPLHAVVTFTMFTVLHETTHHAAGRETWVNEVLGRLSVPFVAAYGAFPLIRYIHIEHHRNTNEAITSDPDAWTSHGPAAQLPFRWATIDIWYMAFYLRKAIDWKALGRWARSGFRERDGHIVHRPRREFVESVAVLTGTLAVFGGLVAAGLGWYLLVIYLIPQRIGLTVLAWWFDWLPHHGLAETAAENRFHATRVRVGLEWLLTPVMLYQNYHLVHHLHPAIPFYRYISAWKKNEQAYLEQDVPIASAWGRELTTSEYRAWRRLADSLQAGRDGSGSQDFHQLTVSEVRKLTPDAVSVAFDVPDELRDTFRFTPGQHLTLELTVNGSRHRRTYSMCTSATSDLVRIAVKQIPDGVVSTYLNNELKPGTVLDVMPPSGRFVLDHKTGKQTHYVGIAAGSGITPIISMLATVLTVDENARFTLLYGNRTADSTMFADELSMLARQFEGRLRIVHYRSGDATETAESAYERIENGRIEAEALQEFAHDDVTAWYLCGPQALIDTVRAELKDAGVPDDRVHLELFYAEATAGHGVASSITAHIGGKAYSNVSSGEETVLESMLQVGANAPYACMGGACGTCRAKLLTGHVEMDSSYALSSEEVEQGYVLTCQARPTTHQVDVDYDA
ncbi:fatty acid desaturase [Hoyosella altamirensis]|uniref:Ferredoxin-NADP reductase/fatty acid desaturase n=1 Tax=Hoyosella altamirensis TaxID=616997 RepID=A0A839RIT5_9ACTN|nr:fatty acid desaturase [Hoyosella altamirensis]MBB3036360.1 ferredoxin-NADP reductase/fatty acid desaturase [Hoyosella altamirensis]